MLGLTPKQKECLDFIRAYIEERGASPSYDEIKDGLGLRSKSGVHRMVHDLAERGHIAIEAGLARTIVLRNPAGSVRVPSSLGLAASREGLSLDFPEEIETAIRHRAMRDGVSTLVVIRDAVAAYVGAGA